MCVVVDFLIGVKVNGRRVGSHHLANVDEAAHGPQPLEEGLLQID